MGSRTAVLIAAGALALLLALATHDSFDAGFWGVDTDLVVAGTATADACLRDALLHDCNAAGYGDVSYFPLPQYAITLAWKRLGGSREAAYEVLVGVSAVALVLLALLVWHACRRTAGRQLAPLAAVVTVGSPLLWYADSGFPDALSALLIGAFAAAVVCRAPWAILALAGAAAALTKETAPPFVLLIGLVGTWSTTWNEPPRRHELAALFAGPAVAVGLHAAFNVFRFGHVHNEYYVRDEWLVPSAGRWIENFVGQVFAPNAGIVWFWLPLISLMTLAAITGARGRPRTRSFSPLIVLALLTAGFATWFGPLSWHAWSARYLVAWLPALFVIALALNGRPTLALLQRVVAARPAGWAVTGALAVAMVPHVAARDTDFVVRQGGAHPECPDGPNPAAAPDPDDAFYVCQTRYAWSGESVVVDALRELGGGETKIWAALLAIAAGAGVACLTPARSRSGYAAGRGAAGPL